MPLDSAWFQARADELRAEEEAAKRELEQAETAEERKAAREEIEDLKRELNELKESQKKADPPAADGGEPSASSSDADDDEPEPKPKTRKGRKHGQVYQDEKGGMGYVYQGEDEPDIVVLDDEEEVA